MTSNPFDIDLNEAFSSAVQRREEAAKEAEQEMLNQAHVLVGDIAFKVHEALNSDDPLGGLQAIHDGAGTTKTVEVDVTDPKIVEELEALRKENQELRTANGRLETAKAQADSKVSQLESELAAAKDQPESPQSPPAPAKKAASAASQKAAPGPTLWERTKQYLTEKRPEQGETTPERSSS